MDDAAISIKNLSITRGEKKLFENFCLDVKRKNVTAIIAPSGSGKTTLLSQILGFLPENCDALSGEIFCDKPVSVIFQEPRLLQNISVLENVKLPLANFFPPEKAHERATEFLEYVSLSEKMNSLPSQISGGERQRVSVARAFAFESKIILMDEPFQSLDLRIKFSIIKTIKSLFEKEKRTLLFVTHDAEEAAMLADRIVVLDGSPLEIKLDIKIDADEIFSGKNDNDYSSEKINRIVSQVKNILVN